MELKISKLPDEKATELWHDGGGSERVREHWRSIMEGNVPFGYKGEED